MSGHGRAAVGRELDVLRPGWEAMRAPIAIGGLWLLVAYLVFGVPEDLQTMLDSAVWTIDIPIICMVAVVLPYLAGSITWDLIQGIRRRP